MAHALSDEQVRAGPLPSVEEIKSANIEPQVAGELKKMVAFIKQEAVEKAREIEIKADEESAIEKSKLVRQETATIDTHYGRKFKQAELSQQIARSTVTNKTRLKVLAARQHLLDHIFEHARGELHNISKDETNYTNVLTNLILEGLFALSEDNVQVRSRNKDAAVLNAALIKAAKEYKEMSGQEISITLDEINTLPENSHGGIFIAGTGGKITINNTLDERLKIIEQDCLPVVRGRVFGENQNRKFYD